MKHQNQNLRFKDLNIPIKIILQEAVRQGINVYQIEDTNIYIAQKNEKQIIFIGSYTSAIPYSLGLILGSRYNVRQILKNNNIPVTPGKLFSYFQKDDALDFAKSIKFPILLRIENSQRDAKSFIGIKNQHEFIQSFNELSTSKENILIEKFCSGNILRFFITKTGFLNVLLKQQPFVVGDGVSSVTELMIKKYSNQFNFNANTVPFKGKKIVFTQCTSFNKGAVYKDITKIIHPSFYTLCQKVINTFPHLSYLGFELITKNYKQKMADKNFIISDVYLSPGPNINFSMSNGKTSQKCDKLLVNLLFSNDIQSRT